MTDRRLPAREISPQLSRTLNLGSGRTPMPGALNVDISPTCAPDLVLDLRRFPWPLPDSAFDRVYCMDVLEHLPDTVRTMEEIHRVATPGGVLHFTTPHFTSATAFTDPTHCHQFGYFSFDFFTGASTHRYTKALFRYRRRRLFFYPLPKNTFVRRVANRWPAFYEQHLGWILPALFLGVELEAVK